MAFPDFILLFNKNDQKVKLTGLKDKDTGAFKNGAAVTATLKDKDGVAVTGFDNITLDYVGASDGDYTGTVTQAFDPAGGGGYTIHLDASEGSADAHWEVPCSVEVRKS